MSASLPLEAIRSPASEESVDRTVSPSYIEMQNLQIECLRHRLLNLREADTTCVKIPRLFQHESVI